MRPVLVHRPPAKHVRHYMEHASTAHLYGLFEAATILCRAVLEFALKEKLMRSDTLEVYRGVLPPKELATVLRWAAVHHDELRANWVRARREEPLHRIAPLDRE